MKNVHKNSIVLVPKNQGKTGTYEKLMVTSWVVFWYTDSKYFLRFVLYM